MIPFNSFVLFLSPFLFRFHPISMRRVEEYLVNLQWSSPLPQNFLFDPESMMPRQAPICRVACASLFFFLSF